MPSGSAWFFIQLLTLRPVIRVFDRGRRTFLLTISRSGYANLVELGLVHLHHARERNFGS
jgi:hypothetical protein